MTYTVNPKVSIPSNWTKPKYYFGQMTRQGEIVGMEYCFDSWRYWLKSDPTSDETESYAEFQINPLSPEELREMVYEEIKAHQFHIAALMETLKQIEG